MKHAVTVITGFVHDFAAGCWAATVVLVWRMHALAAATPQVAGILSELERSFFWAGTACTVVVLATGAGRGFTYTAGFYGPEAEAQRRRLLIAKHGILFVVFGCGTWWQYWLAYR